MDTITAPKNYKFSTKEFRYNFHPDGGIYIHRFPVWKYNRKEKDRLQLPNSNWKLINLARSSRSMLMN